MVNLPINKAPQSRGLLYHFCQRISLSRSLNSASALCFITAGARSGFPPIVISATGGVIRSLDGTGQPEGCVIELEQPAVSNTVAHSHFFDAITINDLLFDDFDSAHLGGL